MRRISIHTLAVAVMVAGSAVELCAQTNTDPATRDMLYLVVFEPGPEWMEGKSVGEQNLCVFRRT